MSTILLAIACLTAISIGIYWYYGGYHKINISIEEQGGETVVYKEIVGEYKQSGEVMNSIYYNLLNEYNITTYNGFGIYFDNPQTVAKEKLRSQAGCIIEKNDIDRLSTLGVDLKTQTLPIKKYIVTEFPYKGKLSIFFSLMNIYPALNKYTQSNGINGDGAVIEIYDIPNKKISYRKEIPQTD